MLKFTRRSEYGLMALAFLGGRPESYCSVREIVASLGLPRRLLAEVLKQLAQAQLVQATRGPSGGYQLARPTRAISLASVIAALEGPVQVSDCQNGNPCELEANCTIRAGIGEVAQRIEAVLHDFTLQDLLQARCELQPGPRGKTSRLPAV